MNTVPSGHRSDPLGRGRSRINFREPVLESSDRNYRGVGASLRQEREAFGLALPAVAAHLRIQQRYLEAIEDGRFAALPGPTYAAGFLRSYGGYLGLDEDALLRAYREETSGQAMHQRLVFPTPIEEARRPGIAVVLAAVAGAVVLYLAVTRFEGGPAALIDLIPAPPERLAALLGEDAGAARPTPPVPATQFIETSTGGSAIPPAAAGVPMIAVPMATADVAGTPAVEAAPAVAPAPAARAEAAGTATPDPLPAALAEVLRDTSASRDVPDVTHLVPAAPPQPPIAAPSAAPAAAGAADGENSEAAAPIVVAARAAADPAAPPATPVIDDSLTTAAAAPPLPPRAPVAQSDVPSGVSALRPREPQAFGAGMSAGRVVLRARADAWVQVQGPSEELLLTRILRAGDTYRVPDRGDITLMTGNAGGLEVIVDGESLGVLGEPGAVRRDIPLEPERLRQQAQR